MSDQYESALIDLCGHERFKSGFERLRPIFKSFLDTAKQLQADKKLKIITLAGTNGKGQCAYQLSKMLMEENCDVFTWTSPHLYSVFERIQKNLNLISQSDFDKSFDKLKKIFDRGERLSFYESLFWIYCDYVFNSIQVSQKDCLQVMVLEVGLGGRLDAVNLFDADIVGLVSIGRDHCEFLGSDLIGIAREKWGVVRSEQTVLSSVTQRFISQALADFSPRPLVLRDLIAEKLIDKSWPYEKRNLVLSFSLKETVMERDFINSKNLLERLFKAPPHMGPGRHQEMTIGLKRFIFIGAHNLDGFREMTKSLAMKHGGGKPLFDFALVSFSRRKREEIQSCLKTLVQSPCVMNKMVITCFDRDHPRAQDAETLSEVARDIGQLSQSKNRESYFEPNWSEHIFSNDREVSILVTGSYYFISIVYKQLLSLKCKTSSL